MTTLREAAQQALEALQFVTNYDYDLPYDKIVEACNSLQAALAEPVLAPAPGYCKHCKQYTIEEPLPAEPVEPVAWYQKRGQEVLTSHPACWGREDEPWTPLYTAPPQLLPLTEDEILKATGHCGVSKYTAVNITRAIERAIWEKNK